MKIPIVDMSAARLIPRLPWFETDDPEIARLASEHLLKRGFKHFAYCGDDQFLWSKWRGEHYSRLLGEAGYPCHVNKSVGRMEPNEERDLAEIGHWLLRLPKPVGIMTGYDQRGQQVLDACRQHGLAVPDEVAVVSVDNDELLCDLSDPPLSSVVLNRHRTGYEAAALLDRMMKGEKVGSEPHFITPLGVATRQSTDSLAIDEPNVAKAMRYIRKHACEGINVEDVLKAVPQSRRQLENRFKKLIGRTPHEEISRVQINRVKQLLVETNLTLEIIAERTGFAHVEYLSVVFKKKTGVPPSKYRLSSKSSA